MRSIKLSFGFVDMKTQMKWNRVKKRFDSRGEAERAREELTVVEIEIAKLQETERATHKLTTEQTESETVI